MNTVASKRVSLQKKNNKNMIVGIGCDIAEFSIAETLNWQSEKKIRTRVFSKKELIQYDKKNKISFLTGRFAAKEAVLKCLGTGMYDGLCLKDIEIICLENGKPKIVLKGKIKKLSIDLGIRNWFVSITHTSISSMAYVIAEN